MKNKNLITRYAVPFLVCALLLSVTSCKNKPDDDPAGTDTPSDVTTAAEPSATDKSDHGETASPADGTMRPEGTSADGTASADVPADGTSSSEHTADGTSAAGETDPAVTTKTAPSNDTSSSPDASEKGFEPITLASGLTVTRLFSYTGSYVEDGKDGHVSGIAAATVRNSGSTSIQIIDFSLTADDGKLYAFQITTLLPGDTVTVLDKNKAVASDLGTFYSPSVVNLVEFPEAPSLHTDVYQLLSENNSLTVVNVSEKTVTAGRIFYKTKAENGLFGGITYMLSVPELAPGASTTISSGHYHQDNSRIMFVTYAD